MFDFSSLLSVALYVLQAVGLYTIAKRRNIAHAWLAWVPVGSVWILGSIADDYLARTGKKARLRVWLVVLTAAVLVLSMVTLVGAVSTLTRVLTVNEMLDVVMEASGVGKDLYAPTEEEFLEGLTTMLDQRLTDQLLDDMVGDVLVMVLASLAMAVAGLAAAILEFVCMHRVFASCDPVNKTLYLLLSIFVGLGGVFLFVCRHKDDGLPKGIHATYEPIE